MIRFKDDVSLFGVRPEIVLAIFVAHEVYRDIGKELVVTSCRDGKHSPGSRHWIGYAVDLRTRHLTPTEALDVRDELADRLTDEFDVVLESNHLHVEVDPKGLSHG